MQKWKFSNLTVGTVTQTQAHLIAQATSRMLESKQRRRAKFQNGIICLKGLSRLLEIAVEMQTFFFISTGFFSAVGTYPSLSLSLSDFDCTHPQMPSYIKQCENDKKNAKNSNPKVHRQGQKHWMESATVWNKQKPSDNIYKYRRSCATMHTMFELSSEATFSPQLYK